MLSFQLKVMEMKKKSYVKNVNPFFDVEIYENFVLFGIFASNFNDFRF